ncbi:hypothetical protein [Streptomyces acidiscabies]|uniref:DUF3558 domain-containing protein n=1 Tax=Streptomyces acidiscabies TaxID=42234 RepID=A0AAP6BHV9_9ACTN|nr:hypothetical protein [Streptomyces acidiscabies]MBZ3910279.1 hypothetical protein [Streptomyces acidiscabies]MDX2965040.1 hypothetical protein [Streptomyces acidiscabies]MDX3024721.1 hypothetical protein [Streptomyces acidiscabies]MDX3796052.1 hypothetical protein [Streptomyces acidiscabies]
MVMSACSNGNGEGEKKYTVPSALCEIKADPKLIDPFLPGGDSLAVKSSNPNGGTKRCDVTVDGKIAVREILVWWGDRETVATVAAAYAKTDDGKVTDDERYLYSGVGAVGKTSEACKSTEHPDQDLYGVVQVFAAGRSDPEAMKELIAAYIQGLEASAECG